MIEILAAWQPCTRVLPFWCWYDHRYKMPQDVTERRRVRIDGRERWQYRGRPKNRMEQMAVSSRWHS